MDSVTEILKAIDEIAAAFPHLSDFPSDGASQCKSSWPLFFKEGSGSAIN
jgi:hypothetical protein